MTDRHLAPVEDEHHAPPQDLAAERATLGGMLLSRNAIDDCLNTVTAPEFYRPAHELIFTAIANLHLAGDPADAITVADELTRTGDLRRAGGASYLHDLVDAVPVASSASYYAQIVSEKASMRRLVEAGLRITQLGYATGTGAIDDLYQAAAKEVETASKSLPADPDRPMPGETLDELLAGDDPEYDWLIPGIFERRDRLILTAGEGSGKSTLLRQIALHAAAGIHPFTFEPITPVRAMLVDLENSRRQSRRKFRPLRLQLGPAYPVDNLIIECKGDGLDLTTTADQNYLDAMIRHHRPDLLITGPIYKLANGNPNDEVDAKPVAMFLDKMRVEHDVAVLLEAHVAKGQAGGKHRPKEPFGWSGWLRWPEFGFNLSDDGELTEWRGSRDERAFPHQLRRGGVWPWMPATSLADQHWLAIRDVARAAGRKMTQRELADATGIRLAAVNGCVQDHSLELAQIWFDIEAQP